MYQMNEFQQRDALDKALADEVADLLTKAINEKGKASLAVSGGSTPKGFFKLLSEKNIAWHKVTITLADERWVDINSADSNTRLVHENLLQNKAHAAKFFHLKQGDTLSTETLADLNLAANSALLPLDVLILGMGEDGHTASLFPCSHEIKQGLSLDNESALLAVQPTTAPHLRISFTFAALIKSQHVFLHICGENKKQVLAKAWSDNDIFTMPIRAFFQQDNLQTQIYWAK